jgi:EAL domain-containing protein (putative c-di-GMP-specific phosphodiesterase class I)
MASEQVTGVEALLRWHHPELGRVSPAEFIPVAESSGLITAIGAWVLRTAVRQLATWIDRGLAPMTMAVNLSAVQFRQPTFPDQVCRILDDAGVAPWCLELELTESVASDDPLGAIAVMDRLHARGVKLSIDDFGTGYSSLNYLKRFKVCKLKIDQSFVQGVTEDAEDQAIVAAIVSMARSLGMRTIAEGVETAAQMEFLRAKGCDEVQGYWFGRPLPADELEAFVRARAP